MVRGYRAWALFTAPVAAWCSLELVVRLALGVSEGAADTALLAGCAAGSGLAALWRARAHAGEP